MKYVEKRRDTHKCDENDRNERRKSSSTKVERNGGRFETLGIRVYEQTHSNLSLFRKKSPLHNDSSYRAFAYNNNNILFESSR